MTTAPDPAQLARTGRNVTAGIWVCAAITMTASVVNGTSVFDMLTVGPLGVVVGLLTALAVDACLVMVLSGDRQMQALGLSSTWGRVLRIATLGMSLALNCGAGIVAGHYFLAGLHAIPPLLIVGMSEYGQEVMLTFTAELRRRERERLAVETAERNKRQAEIDMENKRKETEAAAERTRKAQEEHQCRLTQLATEEAAAMERKTRAERELTDSIAERAEVAKQALTPARPYLVATDGKRKVVAKSSSPVRDKALAYLRSQVADGVDLDSIGPTALAKAIGESPNTVKKGLPQWRATIAELVEAAG